MNRLVVVVAQFLVAWFVAPLIMRFMVPVTLYAVSAYLFAVLAATLVWLAGFAVAQVLSGATQPTVPGFAAAVVAALVVRALLHFIASQDLNVLPPWSIPALVIVAAISGYWSAEDEAELPFDGGLGFIVIVGLFVAALGAFAAIVMMHAAFPPGTYPRLLIALPFLVGGAAGLGIGVGLAYLVLSPFRRRN